MSKSFSILASITKMNISRQTSSSQLDTWLFDVVPLTKLPKDQTHIQPENPEGCIEYKWTLANANADRIQHLSTQMVWRLAEGQGRALYRLGIEDDGKISGISPPDFKKTMNVLTKVIREAKAEKINNFVRRLPTGKMVADVHVRQQSVGILPENENKIVIVGPAQAGKSTLIGCLSHGMLDDAHGSARLTTFRHKHEIISGRTSTATTMDLIGFDEDGNTLDYSSINWVKKLCILFKLRYCIII